MADGEIRASQDQDWESQFLDGGSIDDDLAQFGEDELIVNALKVGGGDLLQYARKLEADLRRKETEAIEDYVKQTAGVANLRNHVEECDNHLRTFEQILVNFQNDLGHVGGQIKDMNARAQALDTLAANRRRVDEQLASFIHGGALPKRLAKAVHEERVGAGYEQLLRVLEAKRAFFAAPQPAHASACAAHVLPVLGRLEATAAERVMAALAARFRALPHHSSPSVSTGTATGPLEELCALAPCVAFLKRCYPQGYQEALDKYVESARGALAAQMRGTAREAARQQVVVLRSRDALFTPGQRTGLRAVLSRGSEAFSRGALPGLGPSRKDGGEENPHEVKLEVFQLRNRLAAAALLEHPGSVTFDPAEEHALEASLGVAMAALIAKIEEQQRTIKTVFPSHPPGILLSIFQTSLQGLEEWFIASARESIDPVSLLLCIRVLQAAHDRVERIGVRSTFSKEDSPGIEYTGRRNGHEDASDQANAQSEAAGNRASVGEDGETSTGEGRRSEARAVSEMEGVFSGMFMAVWPRFKAAIEMQVGSLKTAGGSSSMPSGSDKQVHAITERYAQLTAGLLVIYAGLHSQSAHMAETSITYMCHAMEKFVQRGGETLGGGLKHAFFAINQYDHILAVYHVTGVKAAQCAPMRALLQSTTEGLLPLLQGQAYKEMEEAIASVSAGGELPEKQVKKLLEDFAKGYHTAFSSMHESIAGSVCSATLCSELHKKAACQLLLTYGAFRSLVEQRLPGSAIRSKLVAEDALIEEIKKYDVSANFLDA